MNTNTHWLHELTRTHISQDRILNSNDLEIYSTEERVRQTNKKPVVNLSHRDKEELCVLSV